MIIIKNEKDLIDTLKARINILQFISICVKFVLLHSLHNYINKETHQYIFDKYQSKEELLNSILSIIEFNNQDFQLIETNINAYINMRKIILNDSIKLEWNNTILKQFLLNYLLDSPYWKLVTNELKIIENTNLPSSLKEIINKNLQIGESVPITKHILSKELHSKYFIPIIYINGNIIWGNSQSTLNISQAQREYHNQLVIKYLNDESLHKNDIIKMPINKWKKCDPYNISSICEYARLVTDNNIFIFMYGDIEKNCKKISEIIYQNYNKPVFIITDRATHLKRIASRLKRKNNSYIIIRLY